MRTKYPFSILQFMLTLGKPHSELVSCQVGIACKYQPDGPYLLVGSFTLHTIWVKLQYMTNYHKVITSHPHWRLRAHLFNGAYWKITDGKEHALVYV